MSEADKPDTPADDKESASKLEPAASPPKLGGIAQRRSRWKSSLAAVVYINSLSKHSDVKTRDSDRATSILLLVSFVVLLVSWFFPVLQSIRIPMVLLCNVLVGVMLIFYVANRLGILSTLSPRQALLTWQLMMGASFLGIFMAMNLMLLCTLILSSALGGGPMTPVTPVVPN